MPHDILGALRALLELLQKNDHMVLLLMLLIEEAGVPLPLPGDLLIAFQGYRGSLGEANVVESAITAILAVQLGSTLLYLLSRRLGRTLLFRFGRYLRLDEAKLLRVERWVRQKGATAVFAGRLIPGLRTPTSIIAGTFALPFSQFLLYTTLSAITWCSFWLMLGYLLGQRLVLLADYLRHSSYLVLAAALVGCLLWAWRKRPSPGS